MESGSFILSQLIIKPNWNININHKLIVKPNCNNAAKATSCPVKESC